MGNNALFILYCNIALCYNANSDLVYEARLNIPKAKIA